MLSNYICIARNIYIYIEANILVLYSFLGILKIKNSCLIYYLVNKYIVTSNILNNAFISLFREWFLLVCNGYFNKFKIVGVGYRLFYSNNIVVNKLRYSHLIYSVMPLDIITFKKHKRKRYFTLFSINKEALNKVMHKWLFYRVPNIYTKKGFLKKKKTYLFKKMVKKTL